MSEERFSYYTYYECKMCDQVFKGSQMITTSSLDARLITSFIEDPPDMIPQRIKHMMPYKWEAHDCRGDGSKIGRAKFIGLLAEGDY